MNSASGKYSLRFVILAFTLAAILLVPRPAEGTTFGADTKMTNSLQSQDCPAVAVGPDLSVFSVWQDLRGGTTDIYSARSNDNGSTFSLAVRVDDSSSGEQVNPQFAVDPAGKLHAVWSDNRGGSYRIYYSNSTDNGTTWSQNVLVNASGTGSQQYPSIAVDSDSIYVAWEDSRTASVYHVYFARSTNGGTSFSAAYKIDTSSGTAQHAWVTVSPNGNVTACWQDSRNTNWDVFVAASKDAGASFVTEVNATVSTTSTSQTFPRIASDSDGNLHLAWMDNRWGNWAVYYGKSTDMLTYSSVAVNDTDTFVGGSNQEAPAIDVDTGSVVHISWQDRRSTTNYRIYYSQSTGPTSFASNVRVDNTTGSVDCYYPSLFVDHNNVVSVVWSDTRNSNLDIFYDRPMNAPPLSPDLQAPANDSWVNTGTPAFSWTFRDTNTSDTQSAFQLQLDDSVSFNSVNHDSGVVASATASYTPASAVSEGVYFWRVRTRDNGGVWGPFSGGRVIRMDTSIPSAAKPSDEGQYSVSNTLNWTWAPSTDAMSGIAGYHVSIGTGAGLTDVVLDQYVTTANFTYGGGTNGTAYYCKVKATDNATNTGAYGQDSDGITVDITVPTANTPADAGGYINSSLVKWTWTASTDYPSGIAGYYISVGSGPGLDDLVRDFWVAGTQYTYAGGLNGVTYYLKVKARDNAGNTGSYGGASDGITVDTSIPACYTPVDNGTYSNSTSIFWYWPPSFDTPAGIKGYYLSIGTSHGANDTLADFFTTAGNYTLTGALDGTSYYCRIFSEDNAGNIGPFSASSDGITVDTTQPSDFAVSDDGDYLRTNNTIRASWSSSLDDISGVNEYRYAIGTMPGANDIVNWTSVGQGISFQRAGLSLVNGTTIYISVRARNGAGLYSNIASSDGITVDVTVPDASQATGGYYSRSSSVTWSWAPSQDFPSGIKGYSVTIGTTPSGSDIVRDGWTPDAYYTFSSAQNNRTYYCRIKAVDNAGNIGNYSVPSEPVIVDISVPQAATPVDEGAYNTNGTLLFGWAAGEDIPSGIAWYCISIGTTPGGNDIVKDLQTNETYYLLTGAVSGRTYYAKVRATDNADNAGPYSASSDGITVDTTPPSAPVVYGGGYCGNLSSMTISFSISYDADTPVLGYEYALGTTAGATDIVDWTGAGLRTGVTLTGLHLSDGQKYYISVRASNAAGLLSNVSTGEPVTADSLAPSSSQPAAGGVFINRSVVIWTWTPSSDGESGIAGYHVFAGTSPGGRDIVDGAWTTTASYTFPGGLNGVRYYLFIRASDLAGNTGESSISSEGVTVDTSLPSSYPPVSSSPYSMGSVINWNWTSSADFPSGIAGYYVCVGSFPGGEDITRDQYVTVARYQLSGGLDGKTYYIKIRARDGAGNLGDFALGTGVNVDLTKPSGQLVIEGGASQTARRYVMLTLTSSSPDIQSMLLGSDQSMNGSVWETFTQSRSWVLSAGDGTKSVFARFRDRAGWESDIVMVSIGLDSSVAQFVVASSAGAETRDKQTTVSSAVEPGSRVFINGREVSIGADGHFSTGVELQEGSNVIVVTVIDPAGNSQTLTKSVWRTPVSGALGGGDGGAGAAVALSLLAIILAIAGILLTVRANKMVSALMRTPSPLGTRTREFTRPPKRARPEMEDDDETDEDDTEEEKTDWKEIKGARKDTLVPGTDQDDEGALTDDKPAEPRTEEEMAAPEEEETEHFAAGAAQLRTRAQKTATPQPGNAPEKKLKVVTSEGDVIVRSDGSAVDVEPKIVSEWSPETGEWSDLKTETGAREAEARAGERMSVDEPTTVAPEGGSTLDDFAKSATHREEKPQIPEETNASLPATSAGQRLSAKQIYAALYGKKPGVPAAPATGEPAPSPETLTAAEMMTAAPASQAEAEDKKPLGKARCASCKSVIVIYTTERPLKIECPNCGLKGIIK